MTHSETVSVEFGFWPNGAEEPETPVLVRMKSVVSPCEGEEVFDSGSTNRKEPKAKLANVTNVREDVREPVGAAQKGGLIVAVPGRGALQSKRSTRQQRRSKVMAKMKEELAVHQASFAEAERIARDAENMASSVVTQSKIQLALMEEALEDAVMAESAALEGWQMTEETVSQILGLLKERERLWARAMWKYAFHAVLRGKSKEGTGPAVGAVGVPERRERGRHSEGAEAGAPHRRGRSRTRRGSGSPPLTEENVGRLTKRKIKEQKRNMIQMLDRFIHSLPLEE